MSHFSNDLDQDDSAAASKKRTPPHSQSRYWGEWAGILIVATIIALLLRAFVFQTFWIPSESMENTLMIGDRVIVNKLAYDLGDIERGDIAVFRRPPAEPNEAINDLIKRVVGLPGETVEARDGVVYVNGQRLDEPYLKVPNSTNNLPPTRVPQGELLVLGDNRLNSADGRVFGPISQDLVVGKADVRVWPLDRLGLLSN